MRMEKLTKLYFLSMTFFKIESLIFFTLQEWNFVIILALKHKCIPPVNHEIAIVMKKRGQREKIRGGVLARNTHVLTDRTNRTCPLSRFGLM